MSAETVLDVAPPSAPLTPTPRVLDNALPCDLPPQVTPPPCVPDAGAVERVARASDESSDDVRLTPSTSLDPQGLTQGTMRPVLLVELIVLMSIAAYFVMGLFGLLIGA